MPIQLDGVVSGYVDAGSGDDLAVFEHTVELRADPWGDDEIGLRVEADDLHLVVATCGGQRRNVGLCGDFVDAVGLRYLVFDVVGEVEGTRSAIRQQRLGFVFRILRGNHQIGAHTFLHAIQSRFKVHRQQGASVKGDGEHGDHDDEGRGPKRLAPEIRHRQAGKGDMIHISDALPASGQGMRR